MNKKRSRLSAWLAVALWMGLIFAFSAQTTVQSNHLSKEVTVAIAASAGQQINTARPAALNSLENLNLGLRKVTHFTLYLILGVLVLTALRRSGMSARAAFTLTLLLCALYSGSDEFHQVFVSGRSPLLSDVLIDTAGAAVGSYVFQKLNTKRKTGV